MKKIIAFEWLSLDGFIAGPNEETDWFVWDKEIEKFAKEFQTSIDTMLFGRTTYEVMAAYWPTEASASEDKNITDFMNNASKIVFSKTLDKVEWNNSKLVREITPEEIEKIKEQAGKDIIIYGSGSIVSQLMKLGLLDEFQIMINPVVLGKGKPLFQNVEEKNKLNLLNTRVFKGGNVLLNFQTEKNKKL
jgi:dihydrofolate reductase